MSHGQLLAALRRTIRPAASRPVMPPAGERPPPWPVLAIEAVESTAWQSVTFEGFRHEIVLLRTGGVPQDPLEPCVADLITAERLSVPKLALAECRLVALQAMRDDKGGWRDRLTFQALTITL